MKDASSPSNRDIQADPYIDMQEQERNSSRAFLFSKGILEGWIISVTSHRAGAAETSVHG